MCRGIYSNLVSELKGMCKGRLSKICKEAGLSRDQEAVIICRIALDLDVLETCEEAGMCQTRCIANYASGLKKIEDYKFFLKEEGECDINE